MKLLLTTALAVAFAVAPAFAQPPTAETTVEGNVTVQGLEPSKVLGAIDTSKLVGDQPAPVVVVEPDAQPPEPKKQVVVDTTVSETPVATVETTTEVIAPVSDRPTLDANHPIAPEVHAIVAAKKNYTTADIVKAQHDAMMATPISVPTTTVTTTTTTQKPGG
jgi:hypothetical protein